MSPPGPPAYEPYRPSSSFLPQHPYDAIPNSSHRPSSASVQSNDHQRIQAPPPPATAYPIPPFFPPPSFPRPSTSSSAPRQPPSAAMSHDIEASLVMPPSRQGGVGDRAPTRTNPFLRPQSRQQPQGQQARGGTSGSTEGTEETVGHTLMGMGPTQHPNMPSQLFSFPSSAQPASGFGRESMQNAARQEKDQEKVGEHQGGTDAAGSRAGWGMLQEGHWAPPMSGKAQSSDLASAQHRQKETERYAQRQGDRAGREGCTIHAPKPSRTIDLLGMSQAADQRAPFPLGSPLQERQPASLLPNRRRREAEFQEVTRYLEEGKEGDESQLETQRQAVGAGAGGRRSVSRQGRECAADHDQSLLLSQSQGMLGPQPESQSQPQSQYLAAKNARVDSYHPAQPNHFPSSSRPPAQHVPGPHQYEQDRQHHYHRGQIVQPPSTPAPTPSARPHDRLRTASARPFAMPAVPVMPIASTADRTFTPAWRPATSTLGQKVRNPAELFVAAATQQQAGEGKAKTTSEKILARIDECFDAMMAQISSTTTIQQQARDQLHDLKLGQKAMATREEIVEDIAGQLSPALYESFQALTTSLARLIAAAPATSADLTAEKVKVLLTDMRHAEAAEQEEDEAARKPFSRLVNHLITKLDGVTSIATFLDGCQDLPEALRDVAVYKQSLDAITAMTKQHQLGGGAGDSAGAGVKSVPEMYEELKDSLQVIQEQLGVTGGQAGGGHVGRAGMMGEISAQLKALDTRIAGQLTGHPALPASGVGSASASAETADLSRKVDHLTSELASLRQLITQQASRPPQLDIPLIVAQLREAILAPAIAPQAPPAATGTMHHHPPMVNHGAVANHTGSDYSQAAQPAQIPHHLMTPQTSQRPIDVSHGGLQDVYTSTPFDWEQSGYGALNMNMGNALGHSNASQGGRGGGGHEQVESQYTVIANAPGGGGAGNTHAAQIGAAGGSGFIQMQQTLFDFNDFSRPQIDQAHGHEQSNGQQPGGRQGQYNSTDITVTTNNSTDGTSGTSGTDALLRTMSGHPINDLRSGQFYFGASDNGQGVGAAGAGAGRTGSGSGEADVFGKVRNVPAGLGLATPSITQNQHQGHIFEVPNFSTGSPARPPLQEDHCAQSPVLVPETAPSSALNGEALKYSQMTPAQVGEVHDDDDFVDEYGDLFADLRAPPATPSRNASTGSSRGRGAGAGRRGSARKVFAGASAGQTSSEGKKRAAPPFFTPTTTPLRTPISKKARIDSNVSPSRRSSSAMPGTPVSTRLRDAGKVQPVAARTRRGSALATSAIPSAPQALSPSAKGHSNIPSTSVERFGAPRRMSDRVASIASPTKGENSNGALTSPMNSKGKKKAGSIASGSSVQDPVTITDSSSASGTSSDSGTARNRGRVSKTPKQEADMVPYAHPAQPSSDAGLEVQVQPEEEAGGDDLEATQSLGWGKPKRDPYTGLNGGGRKAVTYTGRRHRTLDLDDSESPG